MERTLSRKGIDAIEISGNRWYAHGRFDRAYYLDAASRLQAYSAAGVILTGGLRDHSDIEKAGNPGVHFFGFARPFINHPGFLESLIK